MRLKARVSGMNRVLVAVAAMALALPVCAQVKVEQPWVRATPPGATVGGGYMTIRNGGSAADRLIGASSPAAARVELHIHVHEGDVMKMRQVRALEVPAGGALVLKPGGAHLMFMSIRKPFKEGERIPVKLKFEKAGEVSAEFPVGGLGDSAAPAHGRQ